MTHDQLQAKCVLWFDHTYPMERGMLVQIYNNARDAVDGAIRNSLGTRKGAFDLILFVEKRAIALDAKVGRDRLSKDQIRFKEWLEERGHEAYTFSSLEEFKSIIYGALGAPKFRSRD